MSDVNRHSRRKFLGAAAFTIATAEMALMGTSRASSDAAKRSGSPMTPIKQIGAGVLDIGYYEAGPTDGPPLLLLHGFPYSIDSYAEVAPMLADRGCRAIVPYLRGHGSTRFLAGDTPRWLRCGPSGARVWCP